MKNTVQKLTLAFLLGGLGYSSLASAAAATLPPVESFFENAAFNGAQLSPNGRYLAVLIGIKDKRDGLAVVDLSDLSVTSVGQFNDTDINQVHWINNERLLFNTHDKSVGQGDAHYGPGLFAVNRDGKMFRQL